MNRFSQMLLLPVAATAVLLASGAYAAEPLKVAADVGYVPHISAKAAGGHEGYNYDLYAEIAKRMGRSLEIIDQEYSGIFAGLNAKKYDIIMAPVTVTEERAKSMLFMEGYLDTDYQFLLKASTPDPKSLDDLKGKTIAVNKGNLYDKWLSERTDQYGWDILRFGKNADAVQAVVTGQAYANLSGNTTTLWIAKQNPLLKGSLEVRTGQVFSSAFRKDDVALRNTVEQILECMKTEGFLAKLNVTWFGTSPREGATAVTVHPGFGQPGFEGYDPTPHAANCK